MVGSFTLEELFEACVPLGTVDVPREVKARACRMAMLEGYTRNVTAARCGVSPSSVTAWTREVELRMGVAKSYRQSVSDAIESGDQRLMAHDYINATLAAFGLYGDEFRGRGRGRDVVLARVVAAFLLRKHTILSFPEIAYAMGRPNHSSVMTMMARYERDKEKPIVVDGIKTTLAGAVEMVEKKLGEHRDDQRSQGPAGEAISSVRRTGDGCGPRHIHTAPRARGIADITQRAVRMGERPVAGGGSCGYEVEAG
ncbi:MAG: helix-turn-helix domain-containing protein [Phycisphaerales bacterium JB064]